MKRPGRWDVRKSPPDGFRLETDGFAASLDRSEVGMAGRLPSRLLYNRGIRTMADAQAFLSPALTDLNPPESLPDVEAAASRLCRAAEAGENIGICGDFDVDGLSGTAVLCDLITTLGGRPMPYIPHREQDGHGVARQAIAAFKDAGVRLMITVDTGTTAVDEITEAKSAGIDTIVTDHHVPGTNFETHQRASLPPAVAIINPHLSGISDRAPLSGAGVAYKLALAACAYVGRTISDDAIALAALGTIADSAPLSGDNRIIVKFGLDQLGKTRHPGLRALLDHSRHRGNDGKPDTELVSFYIAPRLNSAGRLGDAGPSLRLLTTKDGDEAQALATRLDGLNTQRQRLGERAWQDVQPQIKALGMDAPLISVRCDMPPGLLGPLAGKLCETYARPAIASTSFGGVVRASARSTSAFDIHAAVATQSRLLLRFGGHARAAGFSVKDEDLSTVIAQVTQLAAWSSISNPAEIELIADADARIEDLNSALWDFVELLSPFGEGNPAPVFLSRGVRPTQLKRMGADGKHVRMTVGAGGRQVDAIGFGFGDAVDGLDSVDIAYSLRKNLWNGRVRRELQLVAVRPA